MRQQLWRDPSSHGLSFPLLMWQPAGGQGNRKHSPKPPFKDKVEHLVFPRNHQRRAPGGLCCPRLWSDEELSVCSPGEKVTGQLKYGSGPYSPASLPGAPANLLTHSEPQRSPLKITHPTEPIGSFQWARGCPWPSPVPAQSSRGQDPRLHPAASGGTCCPTGMYQ